MAGGSTRRCTLLLAPGQRCKGSGALLPRAGGLPAAASGSGCRMSCWLAAGAIRSVASTAGPANARAETCLTSSAPGPGSRAQQVNVGLRDRRPGGGRGLAQRGTRRLHGKVRLHWHRAAPDRDCAARFISHRMHLLRPCGARACACAAWLLLASLLALSTHGVHAGCLGAGPFASIHSPIGRSPWHPAAAAASCRQLPTAQPSSPPPCRLP